MNTRFVYYYWGCITKNYKSIFLNDLAAMLKKNATK